VDSRNHRVQKFNTDGALLSEWGKLGSGEGEFDSPWGIAADSEGFIYVADHKNHRVQKFTASGEFAASFGSHGSGRGELDRPSGVAVDSDGDVYICDWSNDRVQVFGADGRFITSLRGDARELSHWAKMTVSANPDAVRRRREVRDPQVEWRFSLPTGLVFDTANQRLIVADTQRQRLQIYNKPKDYTVPSRTL
jgi:DNA-binding beta-propeller fold protein YncE